MIGCCGDMKFRQRVAWLGVVGYISVTAFVCYYMFEISDAFNAYALDHNHNYHNKEGTVDTVTHSIILRSVTHLLDLPKPLIIAVIVLLYLQGFFMLIACTKQEPRMYVAYAWPWYVYNRLTRRADNSHHSEKTSPSVEKVIVTSGMPA